MELISEDERIKQDPEQPRIQMASHIQFQALLGIESWIKKIEAVTILMESS